MTLRHIWTRTAAAHPHEIDLLAAVLLCATPPSQRPDTAEDKVAKPHDPEPTRPRRTAVLTTITAGTGSAVGAGAVSAWHGTAVLPMAAVGMLPVLVLISVVLPSIWSRKPERRDAAYNVIRLLFSGAPAEPPAPAVPVPPAPEI